jgi:hypothetical protein
LSQQFRNYCLYDDDFWSVVSSEDFGTPPSSPQFTAGCFCIDADSGDEGGCHDLEDMFAFDLEKIEDGDDLEDLFSFDLDEVATALRRGAGLEELQDLIEKSMATNLESITARSTLPSLAEPSALMAGDISGRMTPGWMTPTASDSAEVAAQHGHAQQEMEGLSDRLTEAMAAPARRRRSSMLQSRLVSQAVGGACARHRQSLATAAAQEFRKQVKIAGEDGNKEEVAAAVRECALKAHRQHRQSILQAAEVVELAAHCKNFGETSAPEQLVPSEVTMQLQMIQQAVEGARRRHRQSIVRTVRSTVQVPEEPKSSLQGEFCTRERIGECADARNALREGCGEDSSSHNEPKTFLCIEAGMRIHRHSTGSADRGGA